jgi:hypothetical protein
MVGRHYGPSGLVGRGNEGVEWEVKRVGDVRHRLRERMGCQGGACARGSGHGCVWLPSSRGRRKLGGVHTAVRGEGGGGLGRPKAKAQLGGRPVVGPGERTQPRRGVIPRSEKEGTKPPYMCLGCSNHTYSNNMITRFHVQ